MTLTRKAWQLIANAKIEQAIQEGQFNALPGFGKPLNLDPANNAGDCWLKRKAQQENLEILPPALVLKRHVERKQQAILEIRDEAKARTALLELNEMIEKSLMNILWGPPCDVLPLEIERFMEAWRDHPNSISDET
jgi:hypothetical protein